MSDQQPQQQDQQQDHVQVGFGKALMMFDPEWRTNLSPEQVNAFRHFYNQGHQDTVLLLNIAEQEWMQRLRSSVQAVQHTIVTLGNEEQIRIAREEAARKAAEEAGEIQTSEPQVEASTGSVKTEKPGRKPALKAAKKPATKRSK